MPIKSPAELELEEARAFAAYIEVQQKAMRESCAEAVEARLAARIAKLKSEVDDSLLQPFHSILIEVETRFDSNLREYAQRAKAAQDMRVRTAEETVREERAAEQLRLAEIERLRLKREENRRIKLERAAARATRVPACEKRPGRDESGQPLTKVYTIRIPADQKAWLAKQAEIYGESITKLCTGVAAGRCSLQTSCPATSSEAAALPKECVSVAVNDDDWDQLAKDAARAGKAIGKRLNPITFAIAAALGELEVAKPGPRLTCRYWLRQLQLVQSAVRLAGRTIPRGPAKTLATSAIEMQRIVKERGHLSATTATFHRTDELFTRLESLCAQIKQRPYQQQCREMWDEVQRIVAEILTLSQK